MTRKERAMELFESGYNCSQAVALAYADILDIDESSLAKLSLSFGGGLGRMREVCGAVSGMAMVLGLLYGTDEPGAGKAEHYARVQELAKKYEAENGSIVCRELLKLNCGVHSAPEPEARTPEYYKKRPCNQLVGYAAEILDEYIKNQE